MVLHFSVGGGPGIGKPSCAIKAKSGISLSLDGCAGNGEVQTVHSGNQRLVRKYLISHICPAAIGIEVDPGVKEPGLGRCHLK